MTRKRVTLFGQPAIMVVSDGNWDPFLVLFDAAGNLLDMNDHAWPMNPGSASGLDSRLDTYRLDADGLYYIAVTPVPRYLKTFSWYSRIRAQAGLTTLLFRA